LWTIGQGHPSPSRKKRGLQRHPNLANPRHSGIQFHAHDKEGGKNTDKKRGGVGSVFPMTGHEANAKSQEAREEKKIKKIFAATSSENHNFEKRMRGRKKGK